jgi:hypothetical protein
MQLYRCRSLSYTIIIAIALVSATLITSASDLQQSPSASDQLQEIQERLKQAHASKDTASYLLVAQKMRGLLNGAPRSIAQLMLAQAVAGKTEDALHSFAEFIQMGQSNEAILRSPELDALRASPQYPAIHTAMLANQSSQSTAVKAFDLMAASIPEDLDFDPSTQFFYFTSVLRKQIVAVNMRGGQRIFAPAPDNWPMMALKIDSQRRILWATEVAIDGFSNSPRDAWGRSAIILFDLKSHKVLHRIEGPPHTALGDMTLTPEGDAVVSDGDGGGIYLVHRETQQIERLDSGDFISPQTPAMLPGGHSILIPDYVRGIAILDIATRHVSWIPMEGRYALNGIDGLYLSGHALLATQNGTSPERVVRFDLDASLARITSQSIIERATPTLGDPTHGVIVDGYFYYIANSGWDTLDEHGNRKSGAPPADALVMRTRLPPSG